MHAISTDRLTKTYGGTAARLRHAPLVHALHDVSITIRTGEIFGFLGPNGAGKSTMIRILLGFLHPTSGGATILGHDVRSAGLEIRRHVGYLPGGVALYDSMSGADILDYLARLYDRPAPLRDELLERLELSGSDLRRPVRDYSRGMRQKVGIVQALQHDPELAILDEPTEGLDPLMQRAFYDILDDRERAGRTIFMSSHVLSEVERVCDRVAIIRAGRVVALSDVDELLARRHRHAELRVEGEGPRLAGVPGVSHVAVHEGVITCDLDGDVGPFLDALRGFDVRDLLIEPARLEEAFLEFYEEAPAPGGPASRDAAPVFGGATTPDPRAPAVDAARGPDAAPDPRAPGLGAPEAPWDVRR